MLSNHDLSKRLKVGEPKKVTVNQFGALFKSILPDMLPDIIDRDGSKISILPLIDYMVASHATRTSVFETLLSKDQYNSAEFNVTPGSCEGVFCDLYLRADHNDSAPDMWPLLTAKTLSEGAEGYAVMGLLGGILAHMLEVYIYTNHWD